MAAPHTKPITIRFNSATRQRLITRAEKQSQTTADVVRSIVADHLAGNDLERRIRVSLEEVLNRTRQEIGDTVKKTVEEALLFLIEQQPARAMDSTQESPMAQGHITNENRQTPRKVYNRTLLVQGRYDDEITKELEAEAERRSSANPGKHRDDFILQLLNEGWKPEAWNDLPMRIPG